MRSLLRLNALILLCTVASSPGRAATIPGPSSPSGLLGTQDCASGFRLLLNDGLHVYGCGGDRVLLRPSVHIDGQWRTPKVADCAVLAASLSCAVGDVGTLDLNAAGGGVRMTFTARRPVVINALALRGPLRLRGAQAWLSHGFQSWSQTGVITLKDAPSATDLSASVLAQGEDEVYRRGREASWWYTYVGGGRTSFLAGVSTAATFKSWIQVAKTNHSGVLSAQLISGGAGESVHLAAGQRIQGETWQVALGDQLQTAMERYSQTLLSRREHKKVAPLFGWNSWYGLWGGVTEASVMANAEELSKHVADDVPLRTGAPYVVIDDGWERAWGDWQPNDKFPSPLSTLTRNLKAQGLEAGIWIAPVLLAPSSPVAKAHPDWLVQGVDYQHPTGRFKVLDVTHPEAAAYLQERIRMLVASGFGLLKVDFLFAAAIEGGHFKPVTGMQAFHLMMGLIREAAGEDTVLVGVGAPPIATFPYVDAWRVGGDIAFSPGPFGLPGLRFGFIANQARSIAGRYPFCRATLCDADPLLMRAPLQENEVHVGSWVVGLAGGGLFFSDPLPNLAAERRTWGLAPDSLALSFQGTPTAPEGFFPDHIPDELVNVRDCFFSPEHDVPSIWRLPGGKRLGANFRSNERQIGGVTIPGHTAVILP